MASAYLGEKDTIEVSRSGMIVGKTRTITIALLVFSIIGTGVGFVLSNAYKLGMCGASVFCRDVMNAGDALLYGMAALAVVFLALLALPRAFSAWGRFAIWLLPFALLYFVGYENESRGFLSFSIPEVAIYQFVSIVLVIWSAIVIGWTLLSAKLNKNAPVKTHILPQGKILRIWWYVYLAVILLVIVSRFLS